MRTDFLIKFSAMSSLMHLVEKYRRNPEEDFLGRDAALTALYGEIKIDLHMYVLGRVNESDIDDVLQEVWKVICTRIQTFKGNTDKEFLKWCYTIAYRKSADSHSHRKKMAPLPLDEVTRILDDSEKRLPMSAQDRLDLKDAMKLLAESKPECHDVLWNHWVLGFDLSEIAEQFQLKYDAARMKLNRCLDEASGLML